jgi:tRNA threonylcarbamoyladenosine biosynthesis protein TsaE
LSDARRIVECVDESATQRLGAALARVMEPGTIVHLHGDLGAGKTTLARALIQALDPGARVKSPTYTLIESYVLPPRAESDEALTVHHLDLYRIADPGELEFLGLADLVAAGDAMLIEWAERGGDATPLPDLELSLQRMGEGRAITLQPRSARGVALADAVVREVGTH